MNSVGEKNMLLPRNCLSFALSHSHFCCGHLGVLNLDMTSEGWRTDLRHTEGHCTLTEKQLAYHSAYPPKSITCLIVLINSNEDYNLQREHHVVINKC